MYAISGKSTAVISIVAFFVWLTPLICQNAPAGARHRDEADTNAVPIEISAFHYELAAGYIGGVYAFGANIRAQVFDQFSIGVRFTLDPGTGAFFTIPYLRYLYKTVGGFEMGKLIRPTVTEFIIPYWETWSAWLGDEKIFMLRASVLSNTPLNAVAYYDLGVSLAFGEADNHVWFGLASVDKAMGPGVRTDWEIGAHTWLLAGTSYMIGQDKDKIAFTLQFGLKQQF